MTELFVGKNTGAEHLWVCIHVSIVNMFRINYKHIALADLTWRCIFIHLTTRPSMDGKRAPLTAISLQAVGSHKEVPPTYIAKMWQLLRFRKKCNFFTKSHINDWKITKKTTRTIKHENFSKMKNLKADRWALSLSAKSCATKTVSLKKQVIYRIKG